MPLNYCAPRFIEGPIRWLFEKYPHPKVFESVMSSSDHISSFQLSHNLYELYTPRILMHGLSQLWGIKLLNPRSSRWSWPNEFL